MNSVFPKNYCLVKFDKHKKPEKFDNTQGQLRVNGMCNAQLSTF